MFFFFFCLVVELQSTEATTENRTLGPADVFVSYCWVNSEKAYKSKQVRVLMGWWLLQITKIFWLLNS